jgi:hypothetical protein
MDPYLRSWCLFVRWLAEVAPSERAFLEGDEWNTRVDAFWREVEARR